MGVTLLTTPRPFTPPYDVIQTNALKSWTLIEPRARIVAFCDRAHEGDAAVDAMDKLGIEHVEVSDTDRSPRGVPLLRGLFGNPNLGPLPCYVNADIILQSDLLSALWKLDDHFETFLAVAGRWNVQVLDLLDFSHGWKDRLWEKIQQQGSRSPEIAVDLFGWKGRVFNEIPGFTIGRYKWDNWIVGNALSQHIPVIDISPVARLIHQVHACVPWEDPDATVNHSIGGPGSGLAGCTFTLTREGILQGWHGDK